MAEFIDVARKAKQICDENYDCENCILRFSPMCDLMVKADVFDLKTKELEEKIMNYELEKDDTDWSKVPVDTKILVKNDRNDDWEKRYFAKYENGKIFAFFGGQSSWTSYAGTRSWEYAKLYEENECEDTINIHNAGFEEGIRCAMCTNPMANDRGCDGGCKVDENMYKKVLDVIYSHTIK